MQNPWPYAIIAWFVVFVSAMAAWTVVAVRQDMDLVRPDYYDEEIRYQKQIDRLNRTAAVREEISVAYLAAEQKIVLRLPDRHLTWQPTGRIHFYRPSDAGLDFEVPLQLDAAGSQRVETGKLRAGLWKVRVEWSAGGQEYFVDQSVVL